jgi:hypothetical protein
VLLKGTLLLSLSHLQRGQGVNGSVTLRQRRWRRAKLTPVDGPPSARSFFVPTARNSLQGVAWLAPSVEVRTNLMHLQALGCLTMGGNPELQCSRPSSWYLKNCSRQWHQILMGDSPWTIWPIGFGRVVPSYLVSTVPQEQQDGAKLVSDGRQASSMLVKCAIRCTTNLVCRMKCSRIVASCALAPRRLNRLPLWF